MTQVNKSTLKLALSERGRGTAVVLLHGLFGSKDNLAQLAQKLAEDYRVISVDLPGHGHSERLGDYSQAVMAKALKSTLIELGLSSICLLGHSLGGKIAMALASECEALHDTALSIEKLIIVDIAPRHYPPRHGAVFEGINAVSLDAETTRTRANEQMAAHIVDAGVRAFLLKSFRRREDGGWFWQFDVENLQSQYNKLAASPPLPAQVRCPTLFIKGSESDYIQAQDEESIRHAFPMVSFKIINGTGHWLHAEKPSAFNNLVHRFLLKE